jgi:O-antigen ligase
MTFARYSRGITVVQGVCFAAFTLVVLGPFDIPDPLGVGAERSWTAVCLATAIVVLGLECAARGWPSTRLDLPIATYVVIALITALAGVDRTQSFVWLASLAGQIGVFAAAVAIARRVPRAAAVWMAGFVGVAFVDLLLATAFHADVGLMTRPKLYASPAGWIGYPQLGTLAVMQFAVLVAALLSWRDRAAALSAVGLLIVSVVELVLLYARGAWAAAACVVAVSLTAVASPRHLRRAIVALALLGVLGAILAAGNPLLRRLIIGDATTPINGYNLELAPPEMRFDLWRRTVRMIADHPLAGVGMGNFQQVFETVYNPEINGDGRRGVHAHNLWLQQFAELGVAGGLAYLWLTGLAWWMAWRAARRDHEFAQVATLLALTALMASNVTTNLFFPAGLIAGRLQSLQWILFAFAVALPEKPPVTAE